MASDDSPMRVVLASASSARLTELQRAGLNPVVQVSGVDEEAIVHDDTKVLVAELARHKAEAVAAELSDSFPTVVIGCDSLLEIEGRRYGKPGSAQAARTQWLWQRRRSGQLHTGHHVVVIDEAGRRSLSRTASTTVHFADVAEDEIDAYVATGEPVHVAGAFTIDGYGAAYISAIEGDHHNVIGISIPLLRQMLTELGVTWHSLWASD